MPKEHFQISNISRIAELPKGARVHLIGICGVAMGQLAVALCQQGFRVSGSDKEFYEPIAGLLKSYPITTYAQYNEQNISADINLVVIGNAVSYGNPEVLAVEKLGLAYTCFPMALYETIIQNKASIVVAGTHGKSTTTGLLAHIFTTAKYDPAFFIGGVAENFSTSLQTSTGGYSIVEGDEYDSAFFAKVPKFSFYKANIFVINALEFDHADIYADLAAIEAVFSHEITRLGANDFLYFNGDDPQLQKFIENNRAQLKCKVISFGENETANIRITNRQIAGELQRISLCYKKTEYTLSTALPGAYNARNIAVSTAIALDQEIDITNIQAALDSFKSVKRRFQIMSRTDSYVLIEDFAHHPTAIRQTLAAVREFFPQLKVLAIFEPRSNTSRRAIFFQEYLSAFKLADAVIINEIANKETETNLQLLDANNLCAELQKLGVTAITRKDSVEIASTVKKDFSSGYIVVVMSNGSFGNLIQKLKEQFASQFS